MLTVTNSAFDPSTGAVAPELKKLRVMIHNFIRIKDGSFLNEVDLRRFAMDSGQPVTNAIVQEVCAMNPRITALSLLNCSQVSDVGLWAIAKHAVHIKKLNCSGCSSITTVGIRSLSLRCSELVELDLSHCSLLDDMSLTVLAGGTWPIAKLSLQNCTKITDNGIAKIAVGLSGSLTHLNINGCPNIGEFGDRGVKELGNNCHFLQELSIDNAKRLEDQGLIGLGKGCPEMKQLLLSGGDNLSKKGLKALADNLSQLQHLKLIQNRRLQENDFQLFVNSPMCASLHTLEIERYESLTDKAVAFICRAVGRSIRIIRFIACHNLTDYSAVVISNFCPELRELDLRFCGHFSDHAIKYMAGKLKKLTSLKMDGNNHITTRTLLRHIERDFEFVEMANEWLGYEPKPAVETLILKKEEAIIHHHQAIKIQCMMRKRFAERIFWVRYREKLIQRAIPLFQAQVRGFIQRKRFLLILQQLKRIRAAIKIQCKWRKYWALKRRLAMVAKRRYAAYVQRLALLIQRMYRGMQGRRETDRRRIEIANEQVQQARTRALQEVRAWLIQRVYRGHVARRRVATLLLLREQEENKQYLLDRSMRLIQRIAHGKIGRLRMRQRRLEVAEAKRRWFAARELQRVYRGHVGRLIYAAMKEAEYIRRRNVAATRIQSQYRGYRGRLLAAVAKALLLLRAQQQFCALEIQRFVRGCMGRHYFKIHKEMVTRERRRIAAVIIMQRLYRGHKGREAREIEYHLQMLESKAKPLFLHLRQLELDAAKLRKTVSKMQHMEQLMADNIAEIERELEHCNKTTNKYTDSVRINNTSQRFLTKFLQVRLQDLLTHETEAHRVKHLELKKRQADLRDLDRDILLTQRELVPLTTGLIANVKRERVQRLRKMIWRRRNAASIIQAVWRRALVRSALYDPYFEGWVERFDRNQSDKPYYFNTMSKQIVWKMPLAYRYFGERTISAMDALKINNQQ